MPSLRFTELLLISSSEEKGFRLPLSANRTILLGPNESGKSSAIKSIYAALGADAHTESDRWLSSRPTLLLRFTVGTKSYAILRHRGYFALFAGGGAKIASGRRDGPKLASALCKLLSVRMRMLSRTGSLVAPPPQYIFMPFYIDQDDGWMANWRSFGALDTLPQNPRKKILEYLLGMKPESYYETQAEIDQTKTQLAELRVSRRGFVSTSRALQVDFPGPILPMEGESFEKEIERLTSLIAEQKADEEARLARLIALRNDLAVIDAQLTAVRRVHQELKRDFDFASESLHEAVQCPTCNASYTNDFAARFEIIDDTKRALELIAELETERANVLTQISEARPAHRAARTRYEQTRDLLQATKGSVTLNQVLSSRATEIVSQVIGRELSNLDTQLDDLDRKKVSLEHERERHADPKKIASIQNFLQQESERIAVPLRIEKARLRSITTPVHGVGSARPRRVLANRLALLHTMRHFDGPLNCPFVVDSPNQQAQDSSNLRRIMKVLLREVRPDIQLILGTEDLFGEAPPEDATVIEMSGPSLLRAEQFESLWHEVEPLIQEIALKL